MRRPQDALSIPEKDVHQTRWRNSQLLLARPPLVTVRSISDPAGSTTDQTGACPAGNGGREIPGGSSAGLAAGIPESFWGCMSPRGDEGDESDRDYGWSCGCEHDRRGGSIGNRGSHRSWSSILTSESGPRLKSHRPIELYQPGHLFLGVPWPYR